MSIIDHNKKINSWGIVYASEIGLTNVRRQASKSYAGFDSNLVYIFKWHLYENTAVFSSENLFGNTVWKMDVILSLHFVDIWQNVCGIPCFEIWSCLKFLFCAVLHVCLYIV